MKLFSDWFKRLHSFTRFSNCINRLTVSKPFMQQRCNEEALFYKPYGFS